MEKTSTDNGGDTNQLACAFVQVVDSFHDHIIECLGNGDIAPCSVGFRFFLVNGKRPHIQERPYHFFNKIRIAVGARQNLIANNLGNLLFVQQIADQFGALVRRDKANFNTRKNGLSGERQSCEFWQIIPFDPNIHNKAEHYVRL